MSIEVAHSMMLVEQCFFFFQAEDGIRDLVRSRGLGDVYKRQVPRRILLHEIAHEVGRETVRQAWFSNGHAILLALSLIHI